MSALSIELPQIIPFAILGASLLGSTHCVGMCGGLAVSAGKDIKNISFYHLGRLTGYLWLGGMAGALGAATLGNRGFGFLSWIASGLLAFALIQMGIQVWRGQGSHLFALPPSWTRALHQTAGSNPFSIGACSALIPCGWLHSFILAAAATQSPTRGALVLLFFWLGTVPALSFSPWILRKILRPISNRMPKATAMLLITAGVLSLGIRAAPLVRSLEDKQGSTPPSCPMHHSGGSHSG